MKKKKLKLHHSNETFKKLIFVSEAKRDIQYIVVLHYFVLFFIPPMLIFQGLHWSITLSIYGLIAFIGNLVFVFILGLTCLPESGLDRFYIVIVGITDFVGQVGVVLINKVERAATGFLLMESTDIIIVFLTQFLIFQVKKSTYYSQNLPNSCDIKLKEKRKKFSV